jgi:hypothetical protein
MLQYPTQIPDITNLTTVIFGALMEFDLNSHAHHVDWHVRSYYPRSSKILKRFLGTRPLWNPLLRRKVSPVWMFQWL